MRLGVITDIHLYPEPNTNKQFAWHNLYPMVRALSQYEAALSRCVAENVDVITILGDIAHIGDDASLALAISKATAVGKPVWVVPGNHDATVRADAYANAIAQHGYPHTLVPQAAGTLCAGFETLRVVGLPVTSDNGGDTARALSSLPTELWQDDIVLLLTHCPIISLKARCLANGLKYSGDLDNYNSVAPQVQQRDAPTLVLHGHLHVRDEIVQDSLLQLSFAALIEPPHEIGILDIDSDTHGLRLQRRNIGVADFEATHLPVLSPAETTWLCRGGVWSRG